MFDFGLNMILLSLQISLCYLTSFYTYLSVNMRKKQVICHIMVSLVWGFVLGNLNWQMDSAIEYIWVIIIEVGYMYITTFLFTEGDFFCNVIRVILGAQTATTITTVPFFLANPQFQENYVMPGRYSDLPVFELVLYDIVIIIVVFMLRPLVVKLICEDRNRGLLYKVFFGLFQISYLYEFVLRLSEELKKGEELHVVYRLILAFLTVVIFIYIVIHSKRRSMEQQKNSLQNEKHRIAYQYEKMVEKNREMHMLRHEWNRQMELIRDALGYVPSDKLLSYVEKLDEKTRHFMMLSLSGNLYLDTVLEYHYTILEEKGIVVEMIIEPFSISESSVMDLVPVVEEMFRFVSEKAGFAAWCRFSIRQKKGKSICQMEIGNLDRKHYCFYKIMDGIGNHLWIRQSFPVTREITKKRNGATYYHFDRQTMEFANLISI